MTILPSASSLILRALNEPIRDKKTTKFIKHDGNLTLDQVVDIAREMRFKSFARQLSGTVKEILGTCNSIGCTVDGHNARSVQQMIDNEDIVIPEE